MIEHYIQKEIIDSLASASSLRFSELKPKQLESNAFLYHINLLLKQGLIEKHESKYRLSNKGLVYVDSLSFSTHSPRKQPKVSVIFAINNTRGDWLFARRKYQPYIGKLMLISGKRHFGESPEVHVKRELIEKTGLSIETTRRGLADIRIYRGKTLITHIMANVYTGCLDNDLLPPSTHQFDYIWANLNDVRMQLVAGTSELLHELTVSPAPLFLSLDVQDSDTRVER